MNPDEKNKDQLTESEDEQASITDNDYLTPSTSTSNISKDSETTNNKRKLEDDDDEENLSIKTLLESIREEIYLNDQTTGLLGGSDENICTYQYAENYVKRQPLYSCKTCKMNEDPTSGEKYLAGICFACAEKCHVGHNLFELYTKRNFCCDCGNDKFAANKCQLFRKDGFNENNQYNHNFKGLYCTCQTPYPDTNLSNDEDMFQCCICEDWFHQSHLDSNIRDGYADMICSKCVQVNDFLVYYEKGGCFDFEEIDEPEVADDEKFNSFCKELDQIMAKRKDEADVNCILAELKHKFNEKFPNEDLKKYCKTMFLAHDWRLKLCICPTCLKMYEERKISFITDPRDMLVVYSYWNHVKETEKQSCKFDHVQMASIQKGFQLYKTILISFLSKFKKHDVVTTKDVEEFKRELNSHKQKKVQYYCG